MTEARRRHARSSAHQVTERSICPPAATRFVPCGCAQYQALARVLQEPSGTVVSCSVQHGDESTAVSVKFFTRGEAR